MDPQTQEILKGMHGVQSSLLETQRLMTQQIEHLTEENKTLKTEMAELRKNAESAGVPENLGAPKDPRYKTFWSLISHNKPPKKFISGFWYVKLEKMTQNEIDEWLAKKDQNESSNSSDSDSSESDLEAARKRLSD